MSKILNSLLDDYVYSNQLDHLLKNENISQYDSEISMLVNQFRDSLDLNGKKQFLSLFEKINEIYTLRDIAMSKALLASGMGLFLELQTDILSANR